MKAKTITEIHSEAEKNLGLRPGATASMRNGRNTGALGGVGPGGFPISRPGSGGMMPGMPGTRKMPGMPGLDADNWEVPRNRSMPRGEGAGAQSGLRVQSALITKPGSINSKLLPQGSGGFISGKTSALLQGSSAPSSQQPSNFVTGVEPVTQNLKPASQAAPVRSPEKPLAAAPRSNTVDLRRKTVSLLEEYFSVRILDEALQCVEELKSPAYHPEVVKEAISLALEKSPPCVEPVVKLLVYLLNKDVLTARDLGTGCLLYGAMLDDIGIDLPKAPKNFGEIMGKLVLSVGLDFTLVKEVLKKVEDDRFQAAIFDAVMSSISSDPSGEALTEKHAGEIQDCKSLFG